jgi:hypothetical protein
MAFFSQNYLHIYGLRGINQVTMGLCIQKKLGAVSSQLVVPPTVHDLPRRKTNVYWSPSTVIV